MKIKSNKLPTDLVNLIQNPDPLEGEDILIENDEGTVIGVILQPKAYEFFIKKVEEKEDESDRDNNETYDRSAKTLDDLLGED